MEFCTHREFCTNRRICGLRKGSDQLEVVTETEDVTILWDYYTKGQRMEANRPGIAIKDKKKICKLMYVKVPSD